MSWLDPFFRPFNQLIQSAGAALTQRQTLNFTGAVTVSDDATNQRTNVAIGGSGSQVLNGTGAWDGVSSLIVVSGSGGRTVTMGAAVCVGMRVSVLDYSYSASAGNILLVGTSSVSGAPQSIVVDGGQIELVASTTAGDWVVLSSNPAIPITFVIVPGQITVNTNDYQPGALAYATTFLINASGAVNVTGIKATALTGGVGGPQSLSKTFINTAAAVISFTNQDVSSVAANRVITSTGATIALSQNQAIDLVYDINASRWRGFKRN